MAEGRGLTLLKNSFWRRAASFLLGLSRPAARELRSKRRVPICLRSSSRASVLQLQEERRSLATPKASVGMLVHTAKLRHSSRDVSSSGLA